MSEEQQRKNELQEFLSDVEADEFAEAVEQLSEDQIIRLHSMYKQMKSKREMRSVIAFNLKRDIKGYVDNTPGFFARCERAPFV